MSKEKGIQFERSKYEKEHRPLLLALAKELKKTDKELKIPVSGLDVLTLTIDDVRNLVLCALKRVYPPWCRYRATINPLRKNNIVKDDHGKIAKVDNNKTHVIEVDPVPTAAGCIPCEIFLVRISDRTREVVIRIIVSKCRVTRPDLAPVEFQE